MHAPSTTTSFNLGSSCRYVGRIDGASGGVADRLMGHLGQCVNGVQGMTPLGFTAMAGVPLQPHQTPQPPPPQTQPPPLQQQHQQHGALQVTVVFFDILC